MIVSAEIARGIHRISLYNEDDLKAILFPGASYNLFLIAATQPAIINTMYRRMFARLRAKVREVLDPATLRYIVVPHHEGDSSGAINEWLVTAPNAVPVCSELCAVLSLIDFAEKKPMVVSDGQVIDLGSHRLRFFMTPQVNQWDSLMVYEETTGTLFPNDLFSAIGVEVSTDKDLSKESLRDVTDLGYQPKDREALTQALDKVEPLDLRVVAPMHGPARTGRVDELIGCFRAYTRALAGA